MPGPITSLHAIAKPGLLVSGLLLVSACATRDLPNTAKEINEECGFEMQAARTAIRLRDKGKSKTHLQSQLPPIDKNSLRLLIKMYEITDEVYEHTQLNETIYTTYRFELCQRELLHKPRPTSISTVLPKLMHCQQTFGDQTSVKSTNCVLAGIENTSVKPFASKPGATDATNH